MSKKKKPTLTEELLSDSDSILFIGNVKTIVQDKAFEDLMEKMDSLNKFFSSEIQKLCAGSLGTVRVKTIINIKENRNG